MTTTYLFHDAQVGMSAKESRAFERGWNASSLDRNPYPFGTGQAIAWRKGYELGNSHWSESLDNEWLAQLNQQRIEIL